MEATDQPACWGCGKEVSPGDRRGRPEAKGNSAMTLSIVVPVFNEVATLREIVRRVLAAPVDLEKELILVDDQVALQI
jgi:hypothetical protein